MPTEEITIQLIVHVIIQVAHKDAQLRLTRHQQTQHPEHLQAEEQAREPIHLQTVIIVITLEDHQEVVTHLTLLVEVTVQDQVPVQAQV